MHVLEEVLLQQPIRLVDVRHLNQHRAAGLEQTTELEQRGEGIVHVLEHVEPLHLIETPLPRLECFEGARKAVDAGVARLLRLVLAGLDADRYDAATLAHERERLAMPTADLE